MRTPLLSTTPASQPHRPDDADAWEGRPYVITEQEPPRLETEESSPTYARIVAEPLPRGFGTTIGNALRRLLLGALPGAAVVAATQ